MGDVVETATTRCIATHGSFAIHTNDLLLESFHDMVAVVLLGADSCKWRSPVVTVDGLRLFDRGVVVLRLPHVKV